MLPHEVRALARRVPAIAITDGAADGAAAMPADPDRDGRLLHGLGVHGDAVEVVELAVELGLLFSPEGLDDLQVLIADRPPILI
jgi:hypothetical protein